MATVNTFTWADYVVFLATIALSVAIGVFYALPWGKARTTGEYLMADRSLGVIPASLSISVSYLSSIAILGNSSEMHYYGATYMFYAVGVAIGILLGALFSVPILYPLRLTSVNEYLTARYESQGVRYFGWFIRILISAIFNGLVLFGPAVMFEAMSGFPVWGSVLLISVASTVYTTIGGLKAVIWTDVFQTIVIFTGLMAVVIKGLILCGGPGEVWSAYNDGYRMDISVRVSPMSRMTVGSIIITGIWHSYSSVAMAQVGVQRVAACRSMRDARLAALATIPIRFLLEALSMLCGVITFAYYAIKGCDPLEAGWTSNENQVLPFFVMEALYYPGFPGLFVACVFCGTLSNLSSGINSTAALTWDDLLVARYNHWPERYKMICTKVLSVLFGIISMGFAFLLSNFGGTLIQVGVMSVTIAVVPNLLMFIVGPLVPRVNGKSLSAGCVIAMVLSGWLTTGTVLSKPHQNMLPLASSNCTGDVINGSDWGISTHYTDVSATWAQTTESFVNTSLPASGSDSVSWVTSVFNISPYLHTPIVFVIGLMLILALSFLPGCHTVGKQKASVFYPCIRRCVDSEEDIKGEEYTMVNTKATVDVTDA